MFLPWFSLIGQFHCEVTTHTGHIGDQVRCQKRVAMNWLAIPELTTGSGYPTSIVEFVAAYSNADWKSAGLEGKGAPADQETVRRSRRCDGLAVPEAPEQGAPES